jgi:hypothetical protein
MIRGSERTIKVYTKRATTQGIKKPSIIPKNISITAGPLKDTPATVDIQYSF